MSVKVTDYLAFSGFCFIGGIVGRMLHHKTYKLPVYEYVFTGYIALTFPISFPILAGVEVYKFSTGNQIDFELKMVETKYEKQ
jgi:hypothetical protein